MPQPRIINQDGKRWEFTPSRHGSLISRPQGEMLPTPLYLDNNLQARAKVLGPSRPQQPQPREQLALLRQLLDGRR